MGIQSGKSKQTESGEGWKNNRDQYAVHIEIWVVSAESMLIDNQTKRGKVDWIKQKNGNYQNNNREKSER